MVYRCIGSNGVVFTGIRTHVPLFSTLSVPYKDILKESPAQLGEWHKKAKTAKVNGFNIEFVETKQVVSSEYTRGDKKITLYVTVKKDDEVSNNLTNNFRQFNNKSVWQEVTKSIKILSLQSNKNIEVKESVYKGNSDYLVSWSWYFIGDKFAGDEQWASVFDKIRYITKDKKPSGVVIVFIQATSVESAEYNLQNFTENFVKDFQLLF